MNNFNKLNSSVNNFNIEKNLVTIKDTEQPSKAYYPSKNLLVS